MNYKTTVDKITQYEIAVLDKNVSPSDLTKYIGKINTLREQLFYALIDVAKKKQSACSVLIDDAIRFMVFEEHLLCKDVTNSQFNGFLKDISTTYQNLQEIDNQEVVYNAIISRLNNVIVQLRNNHEERIGDVYSLLNEIRKFKQQEL